MSADIIDVEAARTARDGKQVTDAMPEIVSEVREFRQRHPSSSPDIARVALDRYQRRTERRARRMVRAKESERCTPSGGLFGARFVAAVGRVRLRRPDRHRTGQG
jgi:hypothetical protein